MSFFKCCVGADPRSNADDDEPRPVSTSLSRRGGAHSAFASDGGASKRKMKFPTEVFFDPTKPDGQLSSITDPATSMRDVADTKKRRDTRSTARKLSVKVGMASNDDIHNPNYHYTHQQQQQPQQQPQQQQQQHHPHHQHHHQQSNSNLQAPSPTTAPHHHHPHPHAHAHSTKTPDLDAQDNNGLTRGQNFMKVEKWLRQACLVEQIDITPPAVIKNIEDVPPSSSQFPDHMADPPSEKDRLPTSAFVNPNGPSVPTSSR